MRWIALLLAVVVIAFFWAMSGDREPATTELQDTSDAPASALRDEDAVSPASELAPAADSVTPDTETGEVATVDPTRRPLALYDEVVSAAVPLDQIRAGEVVSADQAAEATANAEESERRSGTGSVAPVEVQGPGGDPIQGNEVGPGQAFAGQDISVSSGQPGPDAALVGPEFDDPVSLAPEFQTVDVDDAGPGASLTTEPLPGPGTTTTDSAGPGPGYDDPRTPPPTEPDGSP